MSADREVRLGDVADLNWGDTNTTKASYSPQGFTAFSASGPDGFLPYADYDRIGVVVSAIGAECGKSWLASGKWSCIKNTLRFWSTSDDVATEFLYWATLGQSRWPRRGSAQPFIAQTDARNMRVRLPPLAEQRAIAHVLGTLDDKIELNRRTNETLEATARALFKSWFVDFDPVHAKADGRQPVGMDAATGSLFPASFEHSDIGDIPRGWRPAAVDDVGSVNALSLSRADDIQHIDYIEISEVVRGNVGTITRYPRGAEPSRARRRLRHGDTVLSTVRPDRGSYFLCLEPPSSLVASTGFAVISPRVVPWPYLYCSLIREEVFQHLGKQADGGAYPAVRPEVVAAVSVVLPSNLGLVERFSELCEPLLRRMEVGRRENRQLALARDTLLPRLLSGDLRIGEAERLVGDVA